MAGRKTLLFCAFFLIALLCGCSLFNLQNDAESLLTGTANAGSANVAFNIVVPGHANLSHAVRASESGAKVTFRITMLQPDNTSNPTVTFLKTATVQADGSATTTFSGLPEGAAIGEISIIGGNIGGKSIFHGASDLFPGNNTVTVSPKGSLHESDILANAMLAIAADPELIKISKPNLVTNMANAAATLIANPTADVYSKVFESITMNPLTFDSTRYTQIDISSPDGSIRAIGMTTWSITPDQFWQNTPLTDAGLLPVSVPRQGTGDYAIISWKNAIRSNHAFSKLSTTGGTLLYYLKSTSTEGFMPLDGYVLPGDGSIVIAGTYGGKPTLIRWSGKDNTDLSSGLTATGLTWSTVFDIASINVASASISYLEYDKTGTGKILCSIKDPSAGNRLFFVDPATGIATEEQQNNNFGLWAQVGSGTIALGWDGIDAAATYKVYYATGTVLATQTAPLFSTKEKVFLFENLINGQTYTFQIAAIASEGHTLNWSTPIKATPIGATDPIIYSNWKLASNTFEIGSTAMANVNILSFDGQMLSLAITGTSPLKPGSIITGVYNNQPVCVKLPMIPPAPPGQPIMVAVTGASIEEVFEECKYVFRGKMSQLSAMSERLLSPADPMYQSKVTYLRRGMRPSLRAGFTSPITADPSLGDLSLEMENFELDPDVVVDFSTSFGCISQFEIRVDGYAACEVYIKFVASAGVELPAVEGTLLPHQEIPFFVGPVPGTWAREVTASWKLSLQAEAEVKAGTKMRVDFRSGVNYYRETGWGGQLLWRIKNTPIFEASLKGTFTNEAAIEMKNSLKVGGLAGPELTLKPYIKSEALVSTEKPCQVNAALSMGLSGDLKAIVQAWSYNIGEWGGSFEPFGPWVIASHTLSANATPTFKITGPYNLENKLAVKWPNSQDADPYYPHVYTSTGTDSFALSMDDSKGLYKGLSKVEVSFDGYPAFATFQLDAETHSETGITLIPYPLTATLTMSFPFTIDNHMIDKFGTDEKWYTPFRLPPGPHELMFKVYDKCGDHSIATHAIWVQEEKEIWEIKDSEGNILWELGINGFEKGELPEQGRKIAPVPGGLDLSPLKQGPVKHYMNDGTPHIAGNFQNNTRSGIWNMYQKYFYEDVTGSFTAQIEFDSSGKPVNWLDSDVYLDPSYSDYYLRIQQPTSGSSEFSLKQTDASYLLADFSYAGICSFTTGLRTIGFIAATSSYDIETFVDGARNGSATHHIFESYESTVSLYSGEYANNARTGRWVIKIFKNLTEPVSTTEGDLSNDLQTGTWTHSSTDAVTSANYLNNVAQGAFSLVWSGGNHVSGSYPVTGSEQWPILNTAGKQVGTYTPAIKPIPVTWPYPTPEPDEDWR